MNNMIRAELIKLKGSKTIFLAFSILFITVLLIFSMYAVNPKYSINDTGWEKYFQTIFMFINLMSGYLSFYIVTGYIFSREYQESTYITMFTSPIPTLKFYFSKLFLIYFYIIASLILIFIFSTLLGMMITNLSLTPDVLINQLKIILKMWIMHALLIPIASFFAIKWRSFLSVVLMMCIVAFLNIVLVNIPFNTLYPWAVPLLFSPHEGVGRTFINYPAGIFSITFTFILGLILSIKSFSNKN